MTMIYDPDGILDEKYIDITAKKGDRVTVSERSINNGYDPDKEKANQYLKIGEIYTIEAVEVHGWSTDIYLQEIPGIRFNSVHFLQTL